jgi:hypothetical protein
MNENKILSEQNKKLKEKLKQLTDDKLDFKLDVTDVPDVTVDSVDSVDDLVDLNVPDLITESVDDLVDLNVPDLITKSVDDLVDLVDLNNLVLELVEDDVQVVPPNTPIKKFYRCVSQKKISKL